MLINEILLNRLSEERSKYAAKDEAKMQAWCNDLVALGVYPAVSGVGLTPLQMVEFYGAYWHTYSQPINCNICNADFRDLENGPPFKREVGISDRDSVYAWKCPDCGYEWNRE